MQLRPLLSLLLLLLLLLNSQLTLDVTQLIYYT
jgi:hypothetical protein